MSAPLRLTVTCVCGRSIRDTYLCATCTLTLRDDLVRLAETLGDLEITAWRSDRITAPGDGRGSGDRPLPFRPPAADLLRHARIVITGWASVRMITSGSRDRVRPAALCRRLAAIAPSIAARPDAQAFTVRVGALLADVLVMIDLPQTMRYLGHCDACGAALYVERNALSCPCPTRDCLAVYVVAARIAELTERSRDVIASPSTIATALTSLDQPITEERIRKWKERGRLTPRSLNGPRRQAWYRVGDVLDLLDAEAERARSHKR